MCFIFIIFAISPKKHLFDTRNLMQSELNISSQAGFLNTAVDSLINIMSRNNCNAVWDLENIVGCNNVSWKFKHDGFTWVGRKTIEKLSEIESKITTTSPEMQKGVEKEKNCTSIAPSESQSLDCLKENK